jgi:hypothetical protein
MLFVRRNHAKSHPNFLEDSIMMKRFTILALIALVLVGTFAAPRTASAAAIRANDISLSCTSLSGAITATADSNPQNGGFELFIERVTDSNSNVLYEGWALVEMGSDNTFGPGATYFSTTASSVTYQFIGADPLVSKPGVGRKAGKAGAPGHTNEVVYFSTTASCNSVCGAPEGSFQGRVVKTAKLYWAPDISKAVVPETWAPVGGVVSVIDNNTPGWVHISIACKDYFIKTGLLVKNTDPYAKPFLNTR